MITYDYDKTTVDTQSKILSHCYKNIKEDPVMGVLPIEQQKDLAITVFIQFCQNEANKQRHRNNKEMEELRHNNIMLRGKTYGKNFK